MQENREALVQEICQILEDKKGEDIEVFNLSGTDKHALALLDALKVPLKQKGESFYHIDDENPDWIVADLGDVIVHIFTENQRKKFNLEEFLQKLQKQAGSKT